MTEICHVIPVNDEHMHDPSPLCICQPLNQWDTLFVHHAADLREKWERQGIYSKDKHWIVVRIQPHENVT